MKFEEKKCNFLEIPKEEKMSRILVLTCDGNIKGRTPVFWDYVRRYPISDLDTELAKEKFQSMMDYQRNEPINAFLAGSYGISYVCQFTENVPYKSLALLMCPTVASKVSEPNMYRAIYDLLWWMRINDTYKIILPRPNGDGLSWDFIKSSFMASGKEISMSYPAFYDKLDILATYRI